MAGGGIGGVAAAENVGHAIPVAESGEIGYLASVANYVYQKNANISGIWQALASICNGGGVLNKVAGAREGEGVAQ